MDRFTIGDIEQLTGIKSHTLRIWEQRYGIPNPQRTDTNIRYYSDEDLRLLLNMALLNRQGHKISKLSKKSSSELAQMVADAAGKTDSQMELLMAAMFALDEDAFEKILSVNLSRHGLESVMTKMFFPFLRRIGVLWQTGQVNPAFEHFMSNLIRQKIIVAIDAQVVVKKPGSKKFILFLPETEAHELSLLFANYITRSYGHQTLYLGAHLPYTELDSVLDRYRCDYIITVFTSAPSRITTQEILSNMGSRYKDQKILASGLQVTNDPGMVVPPNVRILEQIDDLGKFLKKL